MNTQAYELGIHLAILAARAMLDLPLDELLIETAARQQCGDSLPDSLPATLQVLLETQAKLDAYAEKKFGNVTVQ